jgi:anti-anti-sigma factor
MVDLRVSKNASAMARMSLDTVDFMHIIGCAKGSAATDVNALNTANIRRVADLGESEPCFSLHGDFDIANKRQLSEILEPYIDSQRLTVDLAHVTFIDASIVGIFVRIARRRREIDATRFRIINVSTRFRRIFSLCGLDDVLEIEDVSGSSGKPPFSAAGSLAVTALP